MTLYCPIIGCPNLYLRICSLKAHIAKTHPNCKYTDEDLVSLSKNKSSVSTQSDIGRSKLYSSTFGSGIDAEFTTQPRQSRCRKRRKYSHDENNATPSESSSHYTFSNVVLSAHIEGQPATQRPRIASPGNFCHDPTGILPIVEDPAPGQDLDSCQEQGEQDPNGGFRIHQYLLKGEEFVIDYEDTNRSEASSVPCNEDCQEFDIEFKNVMQDDATNVGIGPEELTTAATPNAITTGPTLVLVKDESPIGLALTTSREERSEEANNSGLKRKELEPTEAEFEFSPEVDEKLKKLSRSLIFLKKCTGRSTEFKYRGGQLYQCPLCFFNTYVCISFSRHIQVHRSHLLKM